MRCSATPSRREQKSRTSWGTWVEAQIVISPLAADHSTTNPRVSIGTGAYPCWRIVSATTCGAAANTASISADGGPPIAPTTLPGEASWTATSPPSPAR